MEEIQTEDQKKLQNLKDELKDCLAAEQLFNLRSGQLITRLLSETINQITKEITSDKYIKDHTGYIKKLAELQANQKLFRQLHGRTNPKIKARVQEAIEDLEPEKKPDAK